MAKKLNNEGKCSLTGDNGVFVRSHILPQALTKPSIKGEALYQSTRQRGEIRRWSSWYDQSLVTRKGEDLLSQIDDAAIKIMRKHQLIWSSWTVFKPHFQSLAPLLPNHGIRFVEIANAAELIRFAHSITWRASASTLSDLSEATLPLDIQEQLKKYTLGESFTGTSSFPVSMTQLSTVGTIHNQVPMIDRKIIFDPESNRQETQDIVRIYLDGLIFHVHFSGVPYSQTLNNSHFLGSEKSVAISSVTYEASYQYENLLHLMRECHPGLVERRDS